MSRHRRVEHWPRLLSEYITLIRHKPFVWGQRDCVLVGLNAARVVTGIDATPDVQGQYDSAIGALRLIRKMGATDLESASHILAARYGGEPISPMYAQRGDLAFIPNVRGGCIAFNAGESWASIDEFTGFGFIPLEQATLAWGI